MQRNNRKSIKRVGRGTEKCKKRNQKAKREDKRIRRYNVKDIG